jgi:hypothetical protein
VTIKLGQDGIEIAREKATFKLWEIEWRRSRERESWIIGSFSSGFGKKLLVFLTQSSAPLLQTSHLASLHPFHWCMLSLSCLLKCHRERRSIKKVYWVVTLCKLLLFLDFVCVCIEISELLHEDLW